MFTFTRKWHMVNQMSNAKLFKQLTAQFALVTSRKVLVTGNL